MRVLRQLPYYVSTPSDLDRGLTLPGELSPFRFPPPCISILICDANVGARAVADEVRATAARTSGPLVSCIVVMLRIAERFP